MSGFSFSLTINSSSQIHQVLSNRWIEEFTDITLDLEPEGDDESSRFLHDSNVRISAHVQMERIYEELEPEAASTSVYEIFGEPAIVINGIPDVAQSNSVVPYVDTASGGEIARKTGFGEWMEGREVRKLFGEQVYSGRVTKYDKEAGWYRVVYEDGDFEDLDWHELEEVLLPLDLDIPLKALALKILKKNERPTLRTKEAATTSRKRPGVRTKRKTMEAFHRTSGNGMKTEGNINSNGRPDRTDQEYSQKPEKLDCDGVI